MRKVVSASEFNRRWQAAQRQAEQQTRRAVADYNRKVDAHNKKVVADLNRQVDAQNRKVEEQNRRAVADYNRQVDQHNRKADAHNKRVVDELNRRLAAGGRPQIRYSVREQELVDRVQEALPAEQRQHDLFLSYARIDGQEVASELNEELAGLGLDVWFDALAIVPGKSQALQMDRGLAAARAGIVVLTPAYLAGRFWTERELGALLHKETLIPVLHGVTFADVAEYSGILPDLAGFTTRLDSVRDIAAKIAGAIAVDLSE
jgi:hypothetical protein